MHRPASTRPPPLASVRGFDDLEVLPLDPPEVIEALDPAVGGDGEPPVASVVRDEHPV